MGCLKLTYYQQRPRMRCVWGKKRQKKSVQRFYMMDPLAEMRYHVSPYSYVQNNPLNRVDPTGMLDMTTRYEDEDGTLLLNTNDGSDAIVTVPNDKILDFFSSIVSSTVETTDSQEWNNMWKAELTGFEWTRLHEQAISRAHSDASRRAMVKYWQTGSLRDGMRMAFAELGAQWTDPGLVAQGILNGFIGYALMGNATRMSTTVQQAKQWLGKDYKAITNKVGDQVFISKDGLRKMRFDIKNSSGDAPHIHLEILRNGKWHDAIPGTHRIYPKP